MKLSIDSPEINLGITSRNLRLKSSIQVQCGKLLNPDFASGAGDRTSLEPIKVYHSRITGTTSCLKRAFWDLNYGLVTFNASYIFLAPTIAFLAPKSSKFSSLNSALAISSNQVAPLGSVAKASRNI